MADRVSIFSFNCQYTSGTGHILLDDNQSLFHLGLDPVLLRRQLFNVFQWLVHCTGPFYGQKFSICW